MVGLGLAGGCSTSGDAADSPSGNGGPTADDGASPGGTDADDGAGDTTAGDGLTGGSADSGGVDDPECDPGCGEGGTCIAGADGSTTCECWAGYAFDGATCIACDPAPESVDLAVSMVALRITVAGQPPPAIASEYGTVTLRHRATGDVVALGDTRSETLTAPVIAGVYDVYFSRVAGSAAVPANRHARIGELDARTDVEHVIDIPVVEISGAFQFDGAPAPRIASESGRVWLRNADTGDSLLLGFTDVGTYAARVIPGRYTLEYDAVAGAEVAPNNGRGVFGSVDVKQSDAPLDIDIPTVRLGGTFSFDGAPAPDVASENGRVWLEHAGERVYLGETRTGAFAVRVLPGAYDVVYEAVTGAEVAPANRRAVITAFTAGKGGDETIDLDIQTVWLAGELSFAGTPAPPDPTDDGYVVLRRGDDDEVMLGLTSNGAYARRVIAGQYDVFYVQDTSGANAPRNTNAHLRALDVQLGVDGDIDIPSVTMSGVITLGGATPPDSDYQDGHVFLRDAATGDSVLLGNTRAGAYTAPVVPGDYQVVYAAATAGEPLPANTGAIIGELTIAAGEPATFAIDVPAMVLAGDVTIDGAPAPMSAADVGNLYLVDVQTRDQVYLGSTFDGAYQRTLIPGDYLVYYRVATSSGAVPANTNAILGCWQLALD